MKNRRSKIKPNNQLLKIYLYFILFSKIYYHMRYHLFILTYENVIQVIIHQIKLGKKERY